MKTIKKSFFALITFAFLSTSLMANTGPDKSNEKSELRAEVVKYLKHTAIAENDVEATLSFTINDNNEIVVLSVKTSDERLEESIKDRLNYKHIKTDVKKSNQTYHIDLTFHKD
jgi:hypothetical protein